MPGPCTIPAVAGMARDVIVFACANPVPEIWPDAALATGARVIATGRSDFPNQVNNSPIFPALFRGALDVRARAISDSRPWPQPKRWPWRPESAALPRRRSGWIERNSGGGLRHVPPQLGRSLSVVAGTRNAFETDARGIFPDVADVEPGSQAAVIEIGAWKLRWGMP
jgi:hypothetical protein